MVLHIALLALALMIDIPQPGDRALRRKDCSRDRTGAVCYVPTIRR